ncbi:MAG: hypothetical protein HYX51_00880 [Chloroflexi bacterium]|nr:hypothetical protein [Chloroflexota bacterium]
MELLQVQVLFQSMSSLAIAGGLIFSAVQFRKTREAQHFANFAKLVEMQMHLREMRVTDPSLANVYRHDVSFAKDEREVREYFFNLMQISVFEIVWFGNRLGQVPDDYFLSWEARMREITLEPSFQRMMQAPSMKIMHDDFQRYLIRLCTAAAQTGVGGDAV